MKLDLSTWRKFKFSCQCELVLYSNLGDPSKGKQYLKRALKGKEQYYKGKADHQVAFTLRSLANVLNELGEHNEAM